MKSFKDREGRAWDLFLTLGSLKRIKAATGLDMLDLRQWTAESNPLNRLSQDPVVLADTLCALCRSQLDQRGLTDEQFADALGGEAIDDALLALVEEWADFFHQGRKPTESTLLRQALDVLKEVRARNAAMAETLAKVTVEQILSRSPTNSPASSESTPAPSPSAN